jgi:hypothetical protein
MPMRRVLIGLAVVVLLAVPSALLFLLARDPGTDAAAPPPPSVPAAPADPLDRPWQAGDRALALSALGWQPAVIDEVGATEAAIHYDVDGLAPERVDLRLLQRPEPSTAEAPAARAAPAVPGKGSRLPPAGGG